MYIETERVSRVNISTQARPAWAKGAPPVGSAAAAPPPQSSKSSASNRGGGTAPPNGQLGVGMHALVEENEDEDEDGEESEYACIKGLIIEPGPPKPPASRSGGGSGGGGGGGGLRQVGGGSVSPQRSASSRTASSSSSSSSASASVAPPVLGPRMGPPMGAQRSMHAKSFTQVDNRPSSMRVATVCALTAALATYFSEFTSCYILFLFLLSRTFGNVYRLI